MGKVDLLLVQPRTGSWDNLGARIPESLLGIASIPEKEGYNVMLIDQRVDSDWKKKLIGALKEKPTLVGMSCMTGPQINYVLQLSNMVKEFDKDTPVMWGGIHPTLEPVQTMQNPLVDVAILGEGEIVTADIMHALEKGEDLSKVDGIVYRKKDSTISFTKPREKVKNLDTLPDLPYHLIDMKKYYACDFRGRPSIILTTSRGCPYRCTFCIDPAIHKHSWRGYSAERVTEKMRFIMDTYGIKDFYFQDDNFPTDIFRFKKILQLMIKEFDDVAWGTLGVRADAVNRFDQETLDLLQKSGCRNIDSGLESGSQRILNLIKKDETIEQYIQANRKIAKTNIIMKYTFIVGFPTETEQDVQLTKKLAMHLINENKNAYCPFFTFCPYSGTEAMELAVKHGFAKPKTLEEWANFNFDGWYEHSPAWLTKRMQKIIKNLNFTSYFANKNVKYKIGSKWGKVLFDLYHPIAKFRFQHDFYYLPLEMGLRNKFLT